MKNHTKPALVLIKPQVIFRSLFFFFRIIPQPVEIDTSLESIYNGVAIIQSKPSEKEWKWDRLKCPSKEEYTS